MEQPKVLSKMGGIYWYFATMEALLTKDCAMLLNIEFVGNARWQLYKVLLLDLGSSYSFSVKLNGALVNGCMENINLLIGFNPATPAIFSRQLLKLTTNAVKSFLVIVADIITGSLLSAPNSKVIVPLFFRS